MEMKIEDENTAREMGFGHQTKEGYNFDAAADVWEGWMLVSELLENNMEPASEYFVLIDNKSTTIRLNDQASSTVLHTFYH